MDLVEAGAGDSALQDAKILLGIDVEGLVVERLLCWVLVVVEEGIVVLVVVQEVELIVDGGIHCDWWRQAPAAIRSHNNITSRVTLPHSDMERTLKQLKVADLRAVLARADEQAPAKATKADLIARILASQPAQDAYRELHEPWVPPCLFGRLLIVYRDVAQEAPVEAVEEEAQPAPEEPAPEPTPDATPAEAPVDAELERRKARAARFGIPLVEQPASKPKKTPAAAKKVPAKEPEVRVPSLTAFDGTLTRLAGSRQAAGSRRPLWHRRRDKKARSSRRDG